MASQKFEKSFSIDQDEKSLSFLVKQNFAQQTLHMFEVVDGYMVLVHRIFSLRLTFLRLLLKLPMFNLSVPLGHSWSYYVKICP